MEPGVGVPHDGKEAVEKQRHHRGGPADPQKRDHEDEYGEGGDRLDDPDHAQDHLADSGLPGGENPQRQGD